MAAKGFDDVRRVEVEARHRILGADWDPVDAERVGATGGAAKSLESGERFPQGGVGPEVYPGGRSGCGADYLDEHFRLGRGWD